MSTMNQCDLFLVIFTSLATLEAKIYFHEHRDYFSTHYETTNLYSDGSQTVKLPGLKGRLRRDSGDGEGKHPQVSTKTFGDAHHNNAILHWSGKDDSSV